MSFDLGGLLSQVMGDATPAVGVEDHFHQVAQSAPVDLLSQGLAAMFHSDQTPAFGEMAGQLFKQADANQQAGMINQLVNGMGPGALASLLAGAGGAGIASVLGQLTQGGSDVNITPEQASQIMPEDVQRIASHAEQHNTSIVETLSGFYAEHAALIKTLGSAALSIALAKMAQSHQS